LFAKRLELLRELVPNAATVAFLVNPNNQNHQSHVRTLEAGSNSSCSALQLIRPSSRCPFRKLYPDIMVVQPRQDWDGDNGAGPLDCPTCGRVFAQRQVRAHLIVVGRIRRKNLPQVPLAEDQHPVQALDAPLAAVTNRC
jgi:hypothetical protein